MEDKTIIQNRLMKNHRKLKKWLSQNNIQAYRLYDKDVPQYPYIIDIYKDSAIVFEKGKRMEDDPENQSKAGQHRSDIAQVLENTFSIDAQNIFIKKREIQKGARQYQPNMSESQSEEVVEENGCKYLVNLTDYLDSGLFLDHRPLRKEVKEESKGKKFLNLFSYTGSFSVAAALGGANTHSVDMSKTYLNWAKRNFELNNLKPHEHEFTHSDVFEFLKREQRKYDIIFCDPPSFSNSKRMQGSFDVQRDHLALARLCGERLNKGGVLYFSTNLRKFKLDPKVSEEFSVKDISLKTIPQDFSDLKIHCCFKIHLKE